MRQQHVHPLRRNDRTWTPHLIAAFDTEFDTGPPSQENGWRSLRCVCARALRRHSKGRRHPPPDLSSTDAGDLADWVELVASAGVPLWLYGHNVAVDVQASGLLEQLLSRGWRLSRHGLANTSLWALLVRGRQSIHLCDSFSLFGCALQRLGELVGVAKTPMPEPSSPIEAWLEYCARDVRVLVTALSTCMDDWERLNLGRWTDTGPGCGWNSLRHRMHTGAVWIDPDPVGRAFERGAIYGGRRELLLWGQWPEAEYADLDLEHAHLSVACSMPLPCGRGPSFGRLELDSPLIAGAGAGIIASCTVTTDTPRYPLRTTAGVVYPTGTFTTPLCGPEIAEARARGELVQVHEGYSYRLGHWAAPWARWVAGILDGTGDPVQPALRQLLKGASKTVWGRTAMRVTGTVRTGDGPTAELRLERGWDRTRDCALTIVDWGWTRQLELQDQEGDDSFPAILAWIQSWVRVLVGRLVDALGTDAVTAIATDGVLVAPWRLAALACDADPPVAELDFTSEVAAAALSVLAAVVHPLQLRLKDVLHRVRALGPETIEAQERRVVSGVPRSALPVAPWRYVGETWPSFVTMTQAPWSGAVLVTERVWDCSRARPLRWVLGDGRCEPLHVAQNAADGRARVLAPRWGRGGQDGALRPDQHQALGRVLEGGGLAQARWAQPAAPG